MASTEQINKEKLPRHIAIIMDGNGRWAKKYGKHRVFGHRSAVKSVREVTEGAAELGIEYLTLYAFSKENWDRPKLEVNALMQLLVSTIRKEAETLQKNKIRLRAIGDIANLPPKGQEELRQAIDLTRNNERMTLILALSYGGRWELKEALKEISDKVKKGILQKDEITEDLISAHLNTAGIPDPELMIRTSGEMRISNFLLWQLAYTELYFTQTLWPDFRKKDLYDAIVSYQNRERRFGKISEQIIGQ